LPPCAASDLASLHSISGSPAESPVGSPIRGATDGLPGLQGPRIVRGPVPDQQGAAESDEEDYACEGYLERKSGEGLFEKVFVELTHDRLRMRGGHHGATSTGAPVLDEWPLSELSGPSELIAGGLSASRCFQVVRVDASASPLVFRCVSERRAAQWVEAINRAWGRLTSRLLGQ